MTQNRYMRQNAISEGTKRKYIKIDPASLQL